MALRYSINNNLVATGTTQATALALSSQVGVHVITTTPASSGVLLPYAQSGQVFTVTNNGSNTLNVYPPVGGNLSSGLNTAVQLVTGSSVSFITPDGINSSIYAYGAGDEPLDQDVNTTASPSWVGITLTGTNSSSLGAIAATALTLSGSLAMGTNSATMGALSCGAISSGSITTNGASLVCGSQTSSGLTTGSVSASGSVIAGSFGGTTAVISGSASVGSTFSAGAVTATSLTFGGDVMNTYIVAGNWTPILSFGGASVGITYSTQLGTYSQVGHIIWWNVSMVLTSKGSSTGILGITLPGTNPGITFGGTVADYSNINLDVGYTQLGVSADSATTFSLSESSAVSGNAITRLVDTNITNTMRLSCSGWFHL